LETESIYNFLEENKVIGNTLKKIVETEVVNALEKKEQDLKDLYKDFLESGKTLDEYSKDC
jgi:hypothetical protein